MSLEGVAKALKFGCFVLLSRFFWKAVVNSPGAKLKMIVDDPEDGIGGRLRSSEKVR